MDYYNQEGIIKVIKKNIKDLRKENKTTQAKLAEGIHIGDGDTSSRTSITTWENDSNQTLPGIVSLIDICNYFNVDCDYILGKTKIKSKDNYTISQVLNISENSVNILRDCKEYGSIINFLLDKSAFSEISKRLRELSYIKVLKDVIVTSFSSNLIALINKTFNNFFNNVFPMDMSKESFSCYLKNEIPYSSKFDFTEYVGNNFLEDGKLVLYNSCENFDFLNETEQYDVLIKTIVDISYDYYMSLNISELSKQRIVTMFSTIIENYICSEAVKIKNHIKENNQI